MKRFASVWLGGWWLVGCATGAEPERTSESTFGADDLTHRPVSGNITHYDYAFDLATGHATAGFAVHAATGGNCFSAGLQLPGVTGATWNGAAASATVASNAAQICGTTIASEAPLTITAGVTIPKQTFLNLDIGFSTKRDMSGGNFTYLMGWVGGCGHLGPCDAAPSRLASYHFQVTHAPTEVVLCPGALTPGVGMTQCSLGMGGGTGALAPTYSAFALASDPLWQRRPFVTAAGVDVVFYEVPAGRIASFLDPASVAGFLTWITGLLGPYPYGTELRYAGAPTRWLGFEHPANIILDQKLPFSGPYQDSGMHALMHETIHQWAGDRTTIASVLDFGWKEATAEYLAYVFEDEQRPDGEAAVTLQYWSAVSLDAAHFIRPTDQPAPALQDFYLDVYGPGGMMYVQLESLLGRPAVLAGIQRFLTDPGARSVDDLRQALELASGTNLAPYFNAWVFGAGKPEVPTFAIATSQVGNQVHVTVTQQNPTNKRYGCKLEIEVRGATTSAVALVDFGVAPASATASATVTLAEPVVDTVFEPRHRAIGRVAGAPAVRASVTPWPL